MIGKLTRNRIVDYVLSSGDVEQASRARAASVARTGNPLIEGEIVPALVVWPHDNADHTFNGQAFLDGNDALWLTSVPYDENGAPGTWHWPPRV